MNFKSGPSDIQNIHAAYINCHCASRMSDLPLKAAVLHVHVSVQMIVRLPLFYQVIETGKTSVRQIRQITAAGTRRVCQQDPDRRFLQAP